MVCSLTMIRILVFAACACLTSGFVILKNDLKYTSQRNKRLFVSSYADSLANEPRDWIGEIDLTEPKSELPIASSSGGDFSVLQTSSSLTLLAADQICDGAIAAVQNLAKPSPVCVTVLDSSGNIIVQKRMDGCPVGAYPKMSIAKARTCVFLTSSSRTFREKYTSSGETPAFVQATTMVSVMGSDIIPCTGGILVRSASDGSIVGAVGVSGAASDEDEYLAIKGVEYVGGDYFVTEPAEHSCGTLR
mmetsp:Transcript_567/g.746  ORF Transcript_567/g.746 Transcript_567/m.746 type:complete len:247 (-) Transcript_567:107-847(-)